MTDEPVTLRTVEVSGGRTISYVEQGAPDGRPLLYFHGAPGLSRLRAAEHVAATQRGVRILAVHRPGYQRSDPQPGRRIADWADTVAEVADRLGLERFGVVGFSNGGAHALACAWRLSDRLLGAGVVAGFAPFDGPPGTQGMSRELRVLYGTGRRAPWALRPMLRTWSRSVRRDPEGFYAGTNADACPSHRAVAEDVEFAATMIADFASDAAAGGRGLLGDVLAHTAPWGFRPEDVETTVHLWHGEQDPLVPVAHGRTLARRLPRCRASFLAEAGHEVLFTRFAAVLDALVPASPVTRPGGAAPTPPR